MPRQPTTLLLILCLLLGQGFSLAHGMDHALADAGDTVCLACLSNPHQPPPLAVAPEPIRSAARHPAPVTTVAGRRADTPGGYSSRAPPRTSHSEP